MSRPFPTDNPFLLGNYAPWPLEGEVHDLPIAGELPREREGTLTAHPKLAPETGEMLFFGYSPLPPFLRYHVVDARGRLTRSVEIEVPVATMMHDFITTKHHVVFMVCPAVFQLDKVAEGGSPIGWRPELGTRIGVLPRDGSSADVRWFDAEPCYGFHPMNAYEDGGPIIPAPF